MYRRTKETIVIDYTTDIMDIVFNFFSSTPVTYVMEQIFIIIVNKT